MEFLIVTAVFLMGTVFGLVLAALLGANDETPHDRDWPL